MTEHVTYSDFKRILPYEEDRKYQSDKQRVAIGTKRIQQMMYDLAQERELTEDEQIVLDMCLKLVARTPAFEWWAVEES